MFDNRGNSSLVPTRALLVSSEIYKPLLLNSCAQGVSGKNKQGGQNNIIMSEIAINPVIITELELNLQRHINVCCCSFNKISILQRKICAAKIVWPKKNFVIMTNFDLFFDLITWDSLMVWEWNVVCGSFINFRKGRKILTLMTFGCPSLWI